jgi:NTP pyrophosphatase (non-canonical NTP hydrolase)
MSTIAELSKEIHENAKNKGFWDKERNMGEILMLIVSEVSEAMEADREDRQANVNGFNKMLEGWDDEHYAYDNAFKMVFEKTIKNTIEDELSDAAIRIMDLAYSRGIDLEWHIKQKMKYNSMREHMHGKKY